MSKIETIYQSFIQSKEFETNVSEKKDIDLDWIKPCLNQMQYLKLEQNISSYAMQNEKDMFEYGFLYAWELFHSCVCDCDK